MGRPCACRCTGATKFYRDYFQPLIPAGQFANINDVFAGVTSIPLLSIDELEDCNTYLIGCWGREKDTDRIVMPQPFIYFEKWTLNDDQTTILSEWVRNGGKVIISIDFREWSIAGNPQAVQGRNVDFVYADKMNAFIHSCGGSISCNPAGPGNTNNGFAQANFLDTALTNGILTPVKYDHGWGNTITGGTLAFNGNQYNQIRYETVGNGLIVVFSSQNTMWGDTVNGGYEAMREFLGRIIAL